ncbi:hypothetical protein [Alkalicoccus luteus]|uniref:Uncharacterized protein n=1 Tax=Alkalicoccus luteus TaxID=1237094 RepID=A0A969PVG0_9BACI|nr:hypothetical protein [Alkalicoccus luteus]NJP39106.1 hypothetical protein [Alkalicoccus luteus]
MIWTLIGIATIVAVLILLTAAVWKEKKKLQKLEEQTQELRNELHRRRNK